MIHGQLAKALHQERIAEAADIRRATEIKRAARKERTTFRFRKRRAAAVQREAHRATVGAFVAFGDGISGATGRPSRIDADPTRSRARTTVNR